LSDLECEYAAYGAFPPFSELLRPLHQPSLVGSSRIALGGRALHRLAVLPAAKRPRNGPAKREACLEVFTAVVAKPVQNCTTGDFFRQGRKQAAV
jgi:hypothetical protein